MTNLSLVQPTTEIQKITYFITTFTDLNKNTPVFMDSAALDVEKQKLQVMQDFEKILSQYLLSNANQKNNCPVENDDSKLFLNQTFRYFLYYFILLFGMFESIAGSYLYGTALFALIPGMSSILIMTVSLIFTALDAIFFYSFQVSFLKDFLKIPNNSSDFIKSIETYTMQVETVISINKHIANIHMLNVDDAVYNKYIELITLLNNDVFDKQDEMLPYPESMVINILKISLLIYGAISNAASSYFFANAILILIAAPLMCTPIGWIIPVLTILSSLVFYYAMSATSLTNLVTPGCDEYQALQQNLELFQSKYENHLVNVNSTRESFKPSNIEKSETLDDTDIKYKCA
jgi:hypothetical protein